MEPGQQVELDRQEVPGQKVVPGQQPAVLELPVEPAGLVLVELAELVVQEQTGTVEQMQAAQVAEDYSDRP